MRRLAVIGEPVSHSRSPAMQNAALEALGMDEEWEYGAIEVSAEDFPDLIGRLPGEDYAGVNVTIPHKSLALEVATEASEAASQIGASNTLTFRDGTVRADNTDAAGVLQAVPDRVRQGSALILGAGGVSRAAVWALSGAGSKVSVWNRSPERAEELVRTLEVQGQAPQVVSDADARSSEFDLIVNCTAVGMPGRDEDPFEILPLERESLDGRVILDLVYSGAETRLVAEAALAGAHAIGGLESLVQQGAESFRIWTGVEPPLDVMREAAADPAAQG